MKKDHSAWPFAAELVVLFSTVDITSVDYLRLVISSGIQKLTERSLAF